MNTNDHQEQALGDCKGWWVMDREETEAFLRELYADNRKLSKKLVKANAVEFQIIQNEGTYPYAASWAGCADIAVFRRKADCKRFIETFKGPGNIPDGSDSGT